MIFKKCVEEAFGLFASMCTLHCWCHGDQEAGKVRLAVLGELRIVCSEGLGSV